MRKEWQMMTGWEFALEKKDPIAAGEWKEENDIGKVTIPPQERFRKVELPHDWAVDMPFNAEMEQGAAQGFRDRWGIGWYIKKLTLEEKRRDSQYLLEFGGIYENSTVWVNRVLAGGRKYGYSSFALDVTEALKEGENEILVRVDNTVSPVDRWYSGCGIYRTVKLVEREKDHLEDWEIVIHSSLEGRTVLLEIETGTAETVTAVLREESWSSNHAEENTGKESIAKESTGKESTAEEGTGKESTAKESAGKESTAKESTGKESTAKEGTGKESIAKESAGKESTAEEGTGKESTAEENTGKESTAKESAGKECTGKENTEKESTGKEITGKESLTERPPQAEDNIVARGCSDGKGIIRLQLQDAALWSAETPHLYLLELTLLKDGRECDRIRRRVGFRDIRFVPNEGMFVNGKRTVLKGACVHQDVGCRGIAAKKELWRQRLAALKEAGCNSIRAAHHVFAEEFLDLCDEMGFYVYEECFDKWHAGLYGRYFDTEWQKDVEAMVKRDRNRACVCIWGVGNEVENQAQPDMLATLKLLTGYVRKLDPSRPVTCAMNPHFKRESGVNLKEIQDIQKFVDEASDTEIYDNEERVERIRRIAEYVDIISCNYQEAWYPLIHSRIPDKLILGTEVFQFFMGDENQIINFTDKNPMLPALRESYVIGGMIWTGYDYLGESMGYPARGWGGSLIRTNGVPRPGYYILQSYWSDKPMVHFSVMDYSQEDEGTKEHWDTPMFADHWHFPQFRRAMIPYVISTNCQEAALYVNEKRFYLPKPGECPNGQIRGFVPWTPGRVTVIGYNEGKEACRHTLVTPGPAARLAFETEEMCLPGETGYEKLLLVQAQDAEGNPCFRESAYVRFRAEGPAEIVAVDNGCLTGDEPYRAGGIHLHQGQAGVLIRLTGESGRVSLWADAGGMYSAQAVLVVEKR